MDYIIYYPFDDLLICDECYGAPGIRRGGIYKGHGDLKKHLNRTHQRTLKFRCRQCADIFNDVKSIKTHIRRNHDGDGAPVRPAPIQEVAPQPALRLRPRRRVAPPASPGNSSDGRVQDDDNATAQIETAAAVPLTPGALDEESPLRGLLDGPPRMETPEVLNNNLSHSDLPPYTPSTPGLEDVIAEVAEVRASINRDLELSRALLTPTPATSTPAVITVQSDRGSTNRRQEEEDVILLDRLAAAPDVETWDSILEETIRARRRQVPRRLDSEGSDNDISLSHPPTNPPPTNSPQHNVDRGADMENHTLNSNDAQVIDPQGYRLHESDLPNTSQQEWIQRLADAVSFEDFEVLVENWTRQIVTRPEAVVPANGRNPGARGRGRGGGGGRGRGVGQTVGRTAGRGPVPGRPDTQNDTAKATKLQRLYRLNKKKAMRQVLGGNNQFCAVAGNEVEAHFRGVFSAGEYTVGEAPRVVAEAMPGHGCGPEDDRLVAMIAPGEVLCRLNKVSNTAPGPDSVPYWAIKKSDPGAHVLANIYSRCLSESRTPMTWKTSNTVLVHKKGDPNNLDNWRPLTLTSCVSKLYTGVLADRIGRWAAMTGRISWAQKGFMEFEGCYEHNFIIKSIIDDARRGNKRAVVAWLDLSNAFGSVPHCYLERVLKMHQLPNALTEVVMELYRGSTTRVRTSEGFTGLIPMAAGVRQGDPLSPILFNLAMEPVIRVVHKAATRCGYSLCGHDFSVVAYADDVALVASNETKMKSLLTLVHEVSTWAGLKFNPRKCASLDIDCTSRRRVLPTTYEIGGAPMACLKEGEEYCHLGVPTGFKVNQTPEQDIAQMTNDLGKIDESLLTPWQKLDAVRTFILPRLDFILRGARVSKGPLATVDKVIKRLAKKWLFLPQRASAEVVYLNMTEGGAGLLPLADQVDVASVVHAFRLLTCTDAVVKDLARATLCAVVRRRIGRHPSMRDIADYLSGRLDGEFGRDGGDISSTWTDARNAAGRLQKRVGISWKFSQALDEFQVHVPAPGSMADPIIVPENARKILQVKLKSALRAKYRRTLTGKPDQGKVIEVSCRSPTSNHFLQAGRYTRFAEWRFIHRARLGTVPLNGCRRWGEGDKRCRRCGEQNETLAHVLNHCRPNSSGWQGRHDAVLERLSRAIPKRCGTVRVNQKVPGVAGGLRPDLVVVNEREKRIHIVDVAIPFENRYEAFTEARNKKIQKYTQIVEDLRLSGYHTTLGAFIIGALGSWDMANEGIIKRLGISSRYAQTMGRLMVSDTIRWSRNIYVTHLTGRRQW